MSPQAQNKRWWIWGPLLAVAFALAVFGDKTPVGGMTSVVAPVAPVAGVSPRNAGDTPPGSAPSTAVNHVLVPRDRLVREGRGAPVRDLFSQRSWAPAPSRAAPAPAPAPPPMAPAMPFLYLGKKLEEGRWEVYLGQGEKTYVVRVGMVLEGQYRVDSIKPPQMEMTYLPLGQVQGLSIGEVR